MLNPKCFNIELVNKLLPLHDNSIIELLPVRMFSGVNGNNLENLKSSHTTVPLQQFYETHDGFYLEWVMKLNNSIRGELLFVKNIWLLQDDQSLNGIRFSESDIGENASHFRMWDLPSMQSISGFLYNDEIGFSKSLYFYNNSFRTAKRLDLDVIGYLNMAYETAGFSHWQQVILDIKEGLDSPETKKFKKWMPQLFPDFSWELFVQKYLEIKLK